ncbi:MAG: type I-C CRISPR-associated protein Cas7/Csd2 [Bryobacterales bacterium]|nr:type I-C CRISPR-associated protein Cas7/Csd2 [Bryobacterales bacterium]
MSIDKRYDFVYLFDCQDGNPNGDPDFDNTPRFDPETFQGLVSDVSLKRKIRDYVAVAKAGVSGYDIFVMSGHSLESRQKQPYEALKIAAKTNDRSEIERARKWMCEMFFDIRAFGAVMSTTDFNCGQVRGPVQITFARSIDRVFTTEHGITRVAYTKEDKAKSTSASTEMGRKHTIAYGLYRTHGFINGSLSRQTGFTADDLALLWKALGNMFDIDRSAARGLMTPRGLYVFEHASSLGEAPAHRLFERIRVARRAGIESPRSFEDYEVSIERENLPNGVNLLEPLG